MLIHLQKEAGGQWVEGREIGSFIIQLSNPASLRETF